MRKMLRSLKVGQSLICASPLAYNKILPINKYEREKMLINTRLDSYWLKIEQMGIKVTGFLFSDVEKNGKGKTNAKILLTNNYNIEIHVSYQEPVHFFNGKHDIEFLLCHGEQVLKTVSHMEDLRNDLNALLEKGKIEGSEQFRINNKQA